MTPIEFTRRMEEISEEGDEEDAHYAGDALMLRVLRSLGYGDGCDAFDEMGKWYA